MRATRHGGPDRAQSLLDWYDRHARVLPWRAGRGERPDPYRVWLSEIMLQQTTVATVGPYFGRFFARWPDIHALAAAALEDVLAAWAGLGYYARARNLHACARAIVANHGGRFPESEAGLRALPGIGPYTAAAIAAIAFDRRAAAIDGNVERVVARLDAIEAALPVAKAAIRARVEGLVPDSRPGDFAQALMDLGATVCTPRKPRCVICPWRKGCVAAARGEVERFPVKAPKRRRPLRHGVAFVLVDRDGAVWLTRRAPRGLLGGLQQAPTTAWRATPPTAAELCCARPISARWRRLPGEVRHGFTHFELVLAVELARLGRAWPRGPGAWWPIDRLAEAGLPTLMRKVLAHAVAHATGRR